jgi:pyruvate, orthophosphate dikinase
VATTADAAVRMVPPVILVRPHTSPLDMHGLAAAAGVVTSTGGPASHAAVVARSMGKPAVVSADLTVEASVVRAGDRAITEGTLIAIDGTSGDVVLGSPRVVTGEPDPHLRRLVAWATDSPVPTSAATLSRPGGAAHPPPKRLGVRPQDERGDEPTQGDGDA